MKYEIEIEGLPEGWDPVAFRAPKKGDICFYTGEIISVDDDFPDFVGRLIVEKIKPRRIVLEDTGEFRQASKGEWIEDIDGEIFKWSFNGKSSGEYKIWREVKDGE